MLVIFGPTSRSKFTASRGQYPTIWTYTMNYQYVPVTKPKIHLLNLASFSGPIARPSKLSCVLCMAVRGNRGRVLDRDNRRRPKVVSSGSDFSERLGDDGDLSCPFTLGLLPNPRVACTVAPEPDMRASGRGRALGESGGRERSVSPMSTSTSSTMTGLASMDGQCADY